MKSKKSKYADFDGEILERDAVGKVDVSRVRMVSSARILFTRVTSVTHYSSKVLFLLLRTAVSSPHFST
jgi:hypothetical protein